MKSIVKSDFVLWVDKVTAKSLPIEDYDQADAVNMLAVALCQSYNIDSSADTESITELAATNPEWADAETVSKSYTVSFDGLLLRTDAEGSYVYDAAQKFEGDTLKVGDVLFFAFTDFNDGTFDPAKVREYGKAVVTSRSKSGTVNSNHTYSITLTGKGKLLEDSEGIPAGL